MIFNVRDGRSEMSSVPRWRMLRVWSGRMWHLLFIPMVARVFQVAILRVFLMFARTLPERCG